MSVTNPQKVVSKSALDCDGLTTVTLSFDAEPELKSTPSDIVLIMDRSGSTSGVPLAMAKQAAISLIETVATASGSPLGTTIESGSHMGMVSFADTATEDVPLSTDVKALTDGINRLSSGGFTNHADAFRKAEALLQGSTLPRKVVIMFTDGATTVGGSADAITESMKQSGIEIYCIGLGKNLTSLNIWATAPADQYVAVTDDPGKLGQVFAAVAAEVVLAGVLDLSLTEELEPDFKIVRIHPTRYGTAVVQDPQTLLWTADAIGAAGKEKAVLSFDIMHIGTTGGTKQVNRLVTYEDREKNTLDFISPEVTVTCGGPMIHPDPCPLPTTFTVDSCKDSAFVSAGDAYLTGLGRIVQVDAVVKNICPDKQVAVAVVLTELDADGVEHARGTKTMLIPAQPGTACQDITLKCITFVVPEALDVSGDTGTICNTRGFRTRVFANYVDTDLVCCEDQTVII